MKVYKLIKAGLTKYLENELMRFTQPGDLNDPFEVRFKINRADSRLKLKQRREEERQAIRKTQLAPRRALKALRSEFQQMLDQVDQFNAEVIERTAQSYGTKTGILSLTEVWNSSRMWAHYASDHKGYAVEFDASHHFFTTDKGTMSALKPVQYVDELYEAMPSRSPQVTSDVSFRKARDWTHEAEWRMVALLQDHPGFKKEKRNPPDPVADEKFPLMLFPVPHDAVTSVLIGVKCSPEDREVILKFGKEKGVKVEAMMLSLDSYALERTPLFTP
jgi:hypothetical protein